MAEDYVYAMSIVERMTGLTRRRIRYYESLGLVVPSRTAGRHRLFSRENVETLRRVRTLLDEGAGTVEAVRRIMAVGLDLPAGKPRERAFGASSTARAPWPAVARGTGDAARGDGDSRGVGSATRGIGDAATRLMRSAPAAPPSLETAGRRVTDTDSAAYFSHARTRVRPPSGPPSAGARTTEEGTC